MRSKGRKLFLKYSKVNPEHPDDWCPACFINLITVTTPWGETARFNCMGEGLLHLSDRSATGEGRRVVATTTPQIIKPLLCLILHLQRSRHRCVFVSERTHSLQRGLRASVMNYH